MSRSAEHDARNTAFRASFQSPDTVRAAIPPPFRTIEACCKKLDRPWHVDDLPNCEGGKIHWMGNRTRRNVILYFHGENEILLCSAGLTVIVGGGYGVGPFDGHVLFLTQCLDRVADAGHGAVVAFLEYGMHFQPLRRLKSNRSL